MLKQLLFAVVAFAAAATIASPAMACDRDCQRILLFGGAFALGRATAPQPQAYGQQPGYGAPYGRQQRPQVFVERHVVPPTTTTVRRIVPAVPPKAPLCPTGRPATPVSSDTSADDTLHVEWKCK